MINKGTPNILIYALITTKMLAAMSLFFSSRINVQMANPASKALHWEF